MDSTFLLHHTSIAKIDANTILHNIKYKALLYLIEINYRKYKCKRHVDKVLKDLIANNNLKDAFVVANKLCISNDSLFLYVPFDDLPPEVKEQTEHMQLMSLAESFYIEKLQKIKADSVAMSTYTMQNLYSTIGIIENANAPFVLLEFKDFTHYLAIKNNIVKVLMYSALHITVLSILFFYIITHIFK